MCLTLADSSISATVAASSRRRLLPIHPAMPPVLVPRRAAMMAATISEGIKRVRTFAVYPDQARSTVRVQVRDALASTMETSASVVVRVMAPLSADAATALNGLATVPGATVAGLRPCTDI